ncbi:hypothetical protein S40293_06057 [Stachybotrys chartarum IBT 40293]|nr:hypothetical protein S40293_06057 [Stachybotrys chartarum IBT 40293]
MASAAPTPTAASSPHQPATQHSNPASPPNRRDLKSWWKGFKLPSKQHQEPQGTAPLSPPTLFGQGSPQGVMRYVVLTADAPFPALSQLASSAILTARWLTWNLLEERHQGIFGVPLRQSIQYANVAISLIDEHGQSYIYGYVPIVVAKCGVFLKEKATEVEGIFRLSGSEKRIKELKTIFDSPDRYGKGLVWEGYTVHDAANVFRRYLNDLPEPVVPLDLYGKFRQPLRGATKQAVGDAEGPQFIENFDEKAAISTYQRLITELPPLNRQLLLYILDLLAVFAAKAEENRMNSQNLAAIFQPGMLSHPEHAMAPEEYRLNQCVIIFLIENQDHFLIGMQGTAADEKTVKEVQSGPAPAPGTPNSKRTSGLVRSASTASAGAESVRKEGMLRRNRSVSSRNSRHDGSTTPNSPVPATTPTGGLGRSNTVPSKKSPAVGGGKFRRAESPGQHIPPVLEPLTQVHPGDTQPPSERSSLVAPSMGTNSLTPEMASVAGRSQEKLLEVPHDLATPHKERNLQALFQRSPTEANDKRQPNKLKKKRIPGSLNPSAHSSNSSLPPSQFQPSPGVEAANPLETAWLPESEPHGPPAAAAVQHTSEPGSDHTPRASQVQTNSSLRPDHASRGKSPPASLHSSLNEGSDVDHSLEEHSSHPADQPDKEKRRRWRLSRRAKEEGQQPETSSPRHVIGANHTAEMSNTSIGSVPSRPRKSFTGDSSDHPSSDALMNHDGNRDSRDEPKGPLGWIRNKYREARENAEQRRNKSPPPERLAPGHGTSILSARGRSLDMKREPHEENDASAAVQASAAPQAQVQIPTQASTQPQLQAPIQAQVQAQAPVQTHAQNATQTTTQAQPQANPQATPQATPQANPQATPQATPQADDTPQPPLVQDEPLPTTTESDSQPQQTAGSAPPLQQPQAAQDEPVKPA